MSELTKEVTAMCGKTILVVGLSNKDEVMYVKSTIRVKPKNRKQKKEIKSQSYRMRKVAKGEHEGSTDTCSALFCNKEVDIGDYSDWEMIDGNHYCPDCYEVEVIDGVYNVKAK